MKLTPLQPWIAEKVAARRCSALSRQDIEAYQLHKLRETLQLVREKSLFYRSHLRRAPTNIIDLAGLAAFPFTTPEDLRQDPFKFLCCSQDEISRVVTLPTSGTSGLPKRVFYTESDQELTVDFFQTGMSTLVGEGDRVLILLPGERPGSVGDLLVKALPRIGAQGILPRAANDVHATLAEMAAYAIDAIVAAPVQTLALARHAAIIPKYKTIHLKSILLSTDYAPRSIRRALEETWGCAVFDHYGMTETGLGGGVECEARRGYHLREADLLFEIVEPGGERVLEEGETGEVVFTTLTRRGMPLLRYRTGDLSRFIPGACPCGTVLKTLATIRSRVDGIVKVGGGDFCLADLDEALFAVAGLLDFSARLVRISARTVLDLAVWWVDERFEDEQGVRAKVKEIPAIKQACERGDLEIQARSQTSPNLRPQAGPLSKRTIQNGCSRHE